MNIGLRDYMAAHAPSPQQPMELAEHCAYRYRYADAMLTAREAGSHRWWIEWHGGERPVDELVRVEVKMKSGETDSLPAKRFRWDHTGYLGDIIAYRVVQS